MQQTNNNRTIPRSPSTAHLVPAAHLFLDPSAVRGRGYGIVEWCCSFHLPPTVSVHSTDVLPPWPRAPIQLTPRPRPHPPENANGLLLPDGYCISSQGSPLPQRHASPAWGDMEPEIPY